MKSWFFKFFNYQAIKVYNSQTNRYNSWGISISEKFLAKSRCQVTINSTENPSKNETETYFSYPPSDPIDANLAFLSTNSVDGGDSIFLTR